jgi:hypothetical protein
MSSAIRDQEVDDPVELDASYTFSRTDRALLDEQIRALEQALLDAGLILGPGTYHTIDGSSSALLAGDVLCVLSSGTNAVKATEANLAASTVVLGVLLENTQPNTSGLVRKFGLVPREITGLAANDAGPVRLNMTTGRCEKVSALSSADIPLGFVNTAGVLILGGLMAGSGGGTSLGLSYALHTNYFTP